MTSSAMSGHTAAPASNAVAEAPKQLDKVEL